LQSANALDKGVFELAKKIIERHPERFIALEEYDLTRKLRRWGNKIRVNFTVDPVAYSAFRDYCARHGHKMSTFIEQAMKEKAENRS
jgi:hypothetical protein